MSVCSKVIKDNINVKFVTLPMRRGIISSKYKLGNLTAHVFSNIFKLQV